MATPLQDIVGKRSIHGDGYECPPCSDGRLFLARLQSWEQEQPMFTLRFRGFDILERADGLVKDRMWGGADKDGKRPRLEAARETGMVEVITHHHDVLREPNDPRPARRIARTRSFPVDQPFDVPFALANRLLQCEPYCTMFEEVDDGTPDVPRDHSGPPPSPADMSRVQALEAQVSKLMGLLQAKTPAPPRADDTPTLPLDDDGDDDDAPPPPGKASGSRRRKR